MKRIATTLLLLSCLYTDIALWACKRATAETRIYVHPICVSPGSCEYWELGFLDEHGQFHFMQRMHQQDLKDFLQKKIMDGTLRLAQ